VSESIRKLLLEPGGRIFPRTELLLYAAGRSQHTEELIRPALERGEIVICERFIHSTLAYQGYGRGLEISLIKKLNYIATGGISPELVIVLDIDSARGLKRVKKSGRDFDRLEMENLKFHRKVRQGYIDMARKSKDMVVINSELPPEIVNKKIISVISERDFIPA
ncbi:MAG: dTMP kinase, partial [Elusimicrobiota bacterium]